MPFVVSPTAALGKVAVLWRVPAQDAENGCPSPPSPLRNHGRAG